MKARADSLPWALGTCCCLFYLLFHSTFYNFDGVACAIAVELSDFVHLVHGNHLAYGLAGWAFFRLWQLLGYSGPALLSLQVLDSLLGGAGVGLFSSLLGRRGFSRPAAVLAACGLAVSQAYWLWSLEAQVYMLGAFFLLLASREAFSERPRPMVVGLCHALAVLAHVGHLMFLAPAVYLLWTSARSKRDLAEYALVLGITVLAAYAAAAAFIVRPGSYEDWRVWLLGSAALNLDKSFVWYGGYSLEHSGQWALMTLRIFADPDPLIGPARLCAWALGGTALAAAVASAVRPDQGTEKRTATAAWIWLASYAALFSSWQPFTVVYRVTDLIPLWLLIACALRRTGPAPRNLLLAVWVLSAGAFNWAATIRPQTKPAQNRAYQEALWIGSATPPEAWIVVTARAQVYVPYFARRRPLNMRYFAGDLPSLRRRLDVLTEARQPAFITSDTLEASDWAGFFKDYGVVQAARRRDMTLYRIKRRESPGAEGRKSSESRRR